MGIGYSGNTASEYPHFMLKEIMEQPRVLEETLARSITPDKKVELGTGLKNEELAGYRRLLIIACGTAYHAGLVGKHFIEKAAHIPVEVELASEFRYGQPLIEQKTLTVAISQSGETADTLAALRLAQAKGSRTVAITNAVDSTITREAHGVIYTLAGPEVSVASTKAYLAQLVTLYLFGLQLARARETLNEREISRYVDALEALPGQVGSLLQRARELKEPAAVIARGSHAYFLGRALDYAVALEGSLKLKETSYIHGEAYAAGEFRHGPIALIEEGIPVIALATQPSLAEKTSAVMEEVKSRGAWIMGISPGGNNSISSLCNWFLDLPETEPEFAPILAVIPLQLLAYYTACARGTAVDTPRHLVKSVQDK